VDTILGTVVDGVGLVLASGVALSNALTFFGAGRKERGPV
jgi:hypothetical protein